MKRATITFPDDLQQALENYCRDQEAPPQLTTVVQTALRHYLTARGYLPPARPLHITPAAKGSGRHDGSIDHDRIIAGG